MKKSSHKVLAAVREKQSLLDRPLVVSIDGHCGSGKSTIACEIELLTSASHLVLDDFYQTSIPQKELPNHSAVEKYNLVYEWNRVSEEALLPLRNGETARWKPFDFVRGLTADGTYSLQKEFTELESRPLILFVGLFSSSPLLSDLVDYSVYIDVPRAECHRRLAKREAKEFLAEWHPIWDEVEDFYFQEVRPPESFDLIVTNP